MKTKRKTRKQKSKMNTALPASPPTAGCPTCAALDSNEFLAHVASSLRLDLIQALKHVVFVEFYTKDGAPGANVQSVDEEAVRAAFPDTDIQTFITASRTEKHLPFVMKCACLTRVRLGVLLVPATVATLPANEAS